MHPHCPSPPDRHLFYLHGIQTWNSWKGYRNNPLKRSRIVVESLCLQTPPAGSETMTDRAACSANTWNDLNLPPTVILPASAVRWTPCILYHFHVSTYIVVLYDPLWVEQVSWPEGPWNSIKTHCILSEMHGCQSENYAAFLPSSIFYLLSIEGFHDKSAIYIYIHTAGGIELTLWYTCCRHC